MFTKSFQHLILWSMISLSPITVLATEVSETSADKPKVSKTISYQKINTLDDDAKKQLLKDSPKYSSNSTLQKALSVKTNAAARHESFDFTLYNVTTHLISDFDYDNFYHRFSITLDVDTLFDHATVYADFYLSYEGGPWVYYASSDDYDIHSDSANDAFTIETELADGYPTGYYDLRIKLYDSESDEYLLTYDNLDDVSLTAIPLEDSFRDEDIVDTNLDSEIIVTHGAGSLNLLSLLLLSILLASRQLKYIFSSK